MWCLLCRIALILLELRAVGVGDGCDGNVGAAAMGGGATVGVEGSEGDGSLSVAVS